MISVPVPLGNVDLDRFFQRFAGQISFGHHIGTTYVAVDDEGSRLRQVAPSEITARAFQRLRESVSALSLPVLRLARLANRRIGSRRGIGSTLSRPSSRCAHDSGRPRCVGVVVDAKPDAIAFYEKLGFVTLEPRAGQLGDRPEPLPIFLSSVRFATEIAAFTDCSLHGHPRTTSCDLTVRPGHTSGPEGNNPENETAER